MHCAPSDLEDQPAALLDWFLQLRSVELEVEAEQRG